MRRTQLLLSTMSVFIFSAALTPVPAIASVTSQLITAEQQSPRSADATASSAAPSLSTPAIPNSSNNYLDDHLRWNRAIVALGVKVQAGTDNVEPSVTYCLPAGTHVIGTASTFTNSTPLPNGQQSGPTTAYLPVALDTDGILGGWLSPKQGVVTTAMQQAVNQSDKTACAGVTPAQNITPTTRFYVSQDDLADIPIRAGWDFGTFVIPFKIQLTRKHDFASSATAAVYGGYRLPIEIFGGGITPVLFTGASNISTSASAGSSAGSQTVAGLSYGVGVITTVKSNFHVGLMLGKDHVSSVQPYMYNDRLWMSFSLGLSLNQ